MLKTGDADAVSIRAIADAVGVTPPSIYLHFPDKVALLFAVCQRQFTRLEESIAKAVEAFDEPIERLKAMGREYVRFGVEHPEQYRILLMTKGASSPEDFERGVSPGVSVFGALVNAVEDCMRSGAIRTDDSFVVATGLWALVHGVTSLRIAMPAFPGIASDDLLDHVLAAYERGLAP